MSIAKLKESVNERNLGQTTNALQFVGTQPKLTLPKGYEPSARKTGEFKLNKVDTNVLQLGGSVSPQHNKASFEEGKEEIGISVREDDF